MQTSRQAEVSTTVTIGNPSVTFSGVEKLERVWIENSAGSPTILEQVMLGEIREINPPDSDLPTRYTIMRITSNAVTILLNVAPETAFNIFADGISEVADLSGSTEPVIPESFHDILVEGVLAKEYVKLEKPGLAKISKELYEQRLSDLRMFIAKSGYLIIQQGKNPSATTRNTGGGGGSAAIGQSAYTQTGLLTFDRDPSAPFAVTDSSAYVANLYVEGVQCATNSVVGRDAAGTGESTNISLTTPIEMDGSNSLRIAADGITDAMLRDSAAVSVIGRSANSTGNPADIAAGSNGTVLKRSSNALSFAAVDLAADVTGDLPLANIAQASQASVLAGRGSAAGAGDYQEITIGTGLSMSGTVLSAAASADSDQFVIATQVFS